MNHFTTMIDYSFNIFDYNYELTVNICMYIGMCVHIYIYIYIYTYVYIAKL